MVGLESEWVLSRLWLNIISRLSNSFLICVFLEQSENISWQPSFNGRKYHLFYWKLFRLYLNEEILWGRGSVMRFDSVVWKWQASSLKVGNEPECKSKYLYSKTFTHVIHFCSKITKACFYTWFISEYYMYRGGGPKFLTIYYIK